MRKSLLVAVFVLLGWISVPAHAAFCPGVTPWVFDDVPDTDPFCGFITDVANRGVTLGCQIIDANHRLYCPTTAVPREQMAAFLSRLASNLFPTTCTSGQVPKWNGLVWACANDNDTDTNSGGTVTSLSQGTGMILTPNPITTTGTIAADTAFLQRRVSGSCVVGSSIRAIAADGSVTCQADANAGGTVTSITAGAGLTGGTITTSGTIAVDPTSPTLTGNFFKQGGNAFGAEGVIGTTDNFALDVRVNGSRVMRYEPNAISPNVIGGHPANNVTAGVRGATIAGGGVPLGNTDPNFSNEAPNRVTDAYGTVGGGYANVAGNAAGTTLDSPFATVGGGQSNTASGNSSTVGGGEANTASGSNSTVGGGFSNAASGILSTVGGGFDNTASGTTSTVGGGQSNTASGSISTVGGGFFNTASGFASWAGGNRAKTQSPGAIPVVHDGAFVWADNNNFDFNSTAANEFAVRATGGVRLVTAIDGAGLPTSMVAISPGATPTLMLRGGDPSNNSSRIRFEELPAAGNCFGGFLFHDGVANVFNLGVNNSGTGDCTPADDINALQIHRFSGRVGVLTAFAANPTFPFTVGVDATNGNGAHVTAGGVWTNGSSRSFKTGFAAVDSQAVLAQLAALPIGTWSYLGHEHERHLGPVAEDFKAAFGLGGDQRYIGTVDADGVALAAIQGLNAKLESKVAEQSREIAELRIEHDREIAELKRAVEVLLARTAPEGRLAAR